MVTDRPAPRAVGPPALQQVRLVRLVPLVVVIVVLAAVVVTVVVSGDRLETEDRVRPAEIVMIEIGRRARR